ncbi:Eukaryotic translation initiation factor 4 gamma 1, partial [Takifugu flavidus]
MLGNPQSVLTKITPERSRSLMEQVKHLNINTKEKLNGAIDLIVEQAMSEPASCATYANMCRELMGRCGGTGDTPSYLGAGGRGENMGPESGDTSQNFANLLLQRCQQEMLKDRNDEDDRSLGLKRFIGELFKLEILNEPIMHECLEKLLNNCHEDSVECLCKLLSTCGKRLDTEEAK